MAIVPPFNKGIANQFDPSHIVPVVIFLILLPFHLWFNRKPIIKYFKGLGWKWALIAIWIAIILWVVVGLPIAMRGR